MSKLDAQGHASSASVIAIVGLSARLPASPDVEALMDNLETGFDAISEIPPARWATDEVYSPDPGAPGKSISKWCGVLDGIEGFDNRFFGIAPAEAAIMDPQQRLLLEEAWRCVENSGLGLGRLRRGRTGVYVGFMATDHLQALSDPGIETTAGHGPGGYPCILANRVSHALALTGPSVAVDAACASSLVALHTARRALLDGEIDFALVAGVSLNLDPWKYVSFSKARMLSPSGRCKTFDAGADGYVPGDGVAVVLLQRADAAHAAGAKIHALVRGSAISHCGGGSFLTAPSVTAQEDVIARALGESGLSVEDITYLEAHGTGTSLGDPIEVEGLRRAFSRFTQRTGFGRIGSIKSNIGHLEGAAGLAGVVKLVMMMRRGVIPPTIHVTTPNPIIDFSRGPFLPALHREDWLPAQPGAPLAAGVSSFGMGGVNAHAVLTSSPARPPLEGRRGGPPPRILLLSARSPAALDDMVAAWRGHAFPAALSKEDICGTLATGREAFRHRAGTMLGATDEPLAAISLRHGEAGDHAWGVFLGDASDVVAQTGVGTTLDALYRNQAPAGLSWKGRRPRGPRHLLAQLGAFKQLGLTPRRVAGCGSGLWAALVASGQLTAAQAIRVLNARRTARSISPRRPSIPFFDPVLNAWRRPYAPDAAYMADLLAGLRLASPALEQLGQSLRPLAESQPNFRRFLAEWGDENTDGAEPLLRALAYRHSMRQIGRRWQLSAEPDRLDPRAAEVEALLDAGMLTPASVARLISGEDLAGLAEELSRRLESQTTPGNFPVLAEASQGQAIDDLGAWITAALASHPAIPEDEGCRWLHLGKPQTAMPRGTIHEPLPLVTRLDASLCLDLWLAGADLSWDMAFPDGSFQRAELPGTCFQRQDFPVGRRGLRPQLPTEDAKPIPEPTTVLYQPAWIAEPARAAAPPRSVVILGADSPKREALARYFADSGATVRLGELGPQPKDAVTEGAALVLLLPGIIPSEDTQSWFDRPLRDLFDTLKGLDPSGAPVLATVATAGILGGLAAGWLASLAQERPFTAVRAIELDGGDLAALPGLLAGATGFARLALRADGAKRFTLAEALPAPSARAQSLDGTWIITGGTGALGRRAAAVLASQGAERILLLGRKARSQALPRFPGLTIVEARDCDVTDPAALARILDEARSVGPIRGVIHAAGLLDDRLFSAKSWEGFRAVLAPKLLAAHHLDRLTRGDPLTLFAVYGSVVGLFGNLGQTDYAAANAALDSLIHNRAAEGAPGRGVSLDWGLWEGTGMGENVDSHRFAEAGLPVLAPLAGDGVLRAALEGRMDGQWLALGGKLGDALIPKPPAEEAPGTETADAGTLRAFLTDRVASLIGGQIGRIGQDDSFFELGLGSVQVQDLTQELSGHFAGVTPTAMFQYATIARLAAYLAERPVLKPLPGGPAPVPAPAPALPATVAAPSIPTQQPAGTDVAIIGMAGRFPGGDTPGAFWRSLAEGRDCITPAPSSRNLPSGPRGGWIDEVDAFDPLFFNISFREAEQMDPQQRLMLETVWATLEDAGYAAKRRRAGCSVGMFVGVMWNEYSLHALEHHARTGGYGGPGALYWAIANRVSYTFDFTGPSMAIDTACSSSLTALHLAVQALAAGDCDMAVAGGVNLSIHPAKYEYLREGRFLSSEGLCRSFGDGGDGYVPGEGVGTVLLKPLERALADGDTIHGIIRGSSANHGGKAAGFTVPNPGAQAALIRRALDRAHVAPAEIGYVECHGTGTALGDPIEIAALAEAFGPGLARGSVPIGSVKSNIGHLEAAAGIAALTKVMQAMRHGQLPRSLHAEVKNPNIDFAATPFRVLDAAEPWRGPAMASISSFGAGGSNAHVVIAGPPPRPSRLPASGPQVFPLSARSAESLRRFAADLAEAIPGLDLRDVAHSLQQGRESFEFRAAVTTGNEETLAAALDALARTLIHPALSTGRVTEGVPPPPVDGAGLAADALAAAFASGKAVAFPPVAEGRIISLPTYRFARERHWIGGASILAAAVPAGLLRGATVEGPTVLLPLEATDAMVAGHVVGGRPVLPAAAGLELIRAAAARIGGFLPAQLVDLAWARPVTVDQERHMIRLSVGALSESRRKVELADSGGLSVLGTALADQPMRPDSADMPALSTLRLVPVDEAYGRFAGFGLAYGPAFQAIKELRLGENLAVARLEAPEDWGQADDGAVLHPALLDAGLQTALALLTGNGGTEAFLPVAIGRAAWWGAMPPQVTAVVRLTPGDGPLRHANLRFTDNAGLVVATLDRVALRRVDLSLLFPKPAALRFSCEAWQDAEAPPSPDRSLLLVSQSAGLPAWEQDLAARGWTVTSLDRARLESFSFPTPPSGEALRILFVVGDDDEDAGKALLAMTQALITARVRQVELVASYSTPSAGANPLAAALGGYARGLRQEQPSYRFRLLEVEGSNEDWLRLSAEEMGLDDRDSTELRRANGRRLARRNQTLPMPVASAFTADPHGAHLITGGLGGLGLVFAEWLAERGARRIALLGRSAPKPEAETVIAALAARGVEIMVVQADLAHDAERAVAEIAARLGPIVGVIHAAGVTRDRLITAKTAADWDLVTAPKIAGTRALDLATAGQPLGYFVLFSSITGILGNIGQADYAFANRFLDAFAEWREAERREGRRQGRAVSIDWPLWRTGRGMGAAVDAATEAALRDAMGTDALTPAQGLEAFEMALALEAPQVLVTVPVAPSAAAPRPVPAPKSGTAVPLAAAEAYVREKLHQETRIPAGRIGARQPFEDFGIDSVMVINLTRAMEADLGPLPKTLFFEYRSLTELAAYLAESHSDGFAREEDTTPSPVPSVQAAPAIASAAADEPIAVIGLAGRYPKAPDLDQFWRNLVDGVDAIVEVPAERWTHDGVHGKWGGFLDRIDHFDPLAFGISPKDAKLMDPQERLFLETARHALEDAGHAGPSLALSRVGVFAGAMWGQYELLGAHVTEGPVPSSSFAGIANRVSYCFNLKGPSLTVDTMCSSSLTALHLACASLRRGECTMALAGGVNLALHPNKYRQLIAGHFLSSDGKCRSFGEGGDGYVPGEGVGVAVLKPLRLAERDNDRILAVIRGSAVNHGGRSFGYTVPGPDAQGEAVAEALRQSGVAADSVSYIEAHGTGTSLGDPIEISGLTKAFRSRGVGDQWRCAIGSAKSSIGHLEAAAGIAGLSKLILQLRHGKLPPSLHSQTLNSNIDWSATPFRVQREAEPWTAVDAHPRRAGLSSFGAGGSNAHLVVEEYRAPPAATPRAAPEAETVVLPLSARTKEGLGEVARRLLEALAPANGPGNQEQEAARLLAEVLGTDPAQVNANDELADLGVDAAALGEWVRRLNARFNTQLTAGQCAALPRLGAVTALLPQTGDGTATPFLPDVAFTLQMGREPMAERLAVVAATPVEAAAALRAFLDGGEPDAAIGWHRDRATQPPADAEALAEAALENRDLAGLAALWVQGAPVTWSRLHTAGQRRRVALPTYPFERQRHWFDNPPAPSALAASPAPNSDERTRMNDWEARAAHWNGDAVRLETIDGEIALVTMRDLANRNMFTDELVLGLVKAFATIRDEARHKVVVITGEGATFSMGGTPEMLRAISESRARFVDVPFMYRGLLECEVPVISAIQGHASGGGLLFGLYADMVVMSEDGLYSAVFTKYGFTPGMGATFILKERLGGNIAAEMMFSAKPFLGAELRARGASVVFRPGAAVQTEALSIARGLIDKPRETLKVLKQELAGRLLTVLPAIIETELAMHARTFTTDEVKRRLEVLLPLAAPSPQVVTPMPITTPTPTPTPSAPAVKLRLRDPARPAAPEPVTAGPDVEAGLRSILGRLLQIAPEELAGDIGFNDLGLDSVGVVEAVRDINSAFGTRVEASDFYDHPNLVALARWMISRFGLASPAAAAVAPAPATTALRLRSVAEAVQAPRPITQAVAAPTAKARDESATVAALAGRILQIPPEELPRDQPFLELGLDSIGGVELIHEINTHFGTRLEAADLYDHSTVLLLAAEVVRLTPSPVAAPPLPVVVAPAPVAAQPLRPVTPPAPAVSATDIAVIGMACRYPGAEDADALWDLLLAGADRVSEIPAERWEADAFYHPDPEEAGRSVSRWGGFLNDVAGFDAEFFGLSPMEAGIMDPQQRLVLEECWHALENAAIAPQSLSGRRCGVFLGAAVGDYEALVREAGLDGTAHAFLGLSPSILASRIAYHLNLKGPCLSLDTACSSSLVAIHEACRSLRDGETELALAGGVVLMLTPKLHLRAGKTGMLSPTGRCRPFDAAADGIALAEGVGIVALKPLAQALADGDPIRAVIRGSGVNQDGRTNGITAPSARSQTELEALVHDRAGISAAAIGYVETHGTGTPLGDPIEVKALTEAFRRATDATGFCALGSVKANIGHATVAAGAAGLIKAVLCLEHGTIPPVPHFRSANPQIDFAATPFFVNGTTIPWPQNGPRRLAAVSSFGFSGTNAHVVLEQAPPGAAPGNQSGPVLVPVSARTRQSLINAIARLGAALSRAGAPGLAEVACTLILGRDVFAERVAFVAADNHDLRRQLAAWTPGSTPSSAGADPQGLRAIANAWMAGGTIDLSAHAPSGRRVPLPGYAFEHERHWVTGPKQAAHPLLQTREADGVSNRFSGAEFFLTDHMATGRRILSATAFLEMAAAAHRAIAGQPAAGLEDVAWSMPLEERNGALPTVRLRFQGSAFTVAATLDGGEETCCAGRVLTQAPSLPGAESPEAVRRRCPRRVSGAEIYTALGAKGLNLGPTFRWIDEALLGDGEVLVRLRPAENADQRFDLHPGQFDSCLQGVSLLIDPSLSDTALFLPVRVGRVVLTAPLATAAFAHIRLGAGMASGVERAFHVQVTDQAGRLLVSVENFTLRRVERTSAPILYLAPRWQEKFLAPAGGGLPLLLTDNVGLAIAAAARGLTTADMTGLPATAGSVVAVFSGGDPAELFASLHCIATTLLKQGNSPRLLLASMGGEGPDPLPALAAFAGSLAKESDRLRLSTLSLGGLTGESAITALLTELSAAPGTCARIQGGRRLIASRTEIAPAASAEPPWRRGGTYLITGGFGRLGLAVAGHLARHYQARLVLVGRRQPDRVAINALQASGAQVLALTADLSAPDAAATLVSQAKAQFGVIHGVIHAAGLLRDGLFATKPLADAMTVLTPKLAAAALDRALADEKLELFVLFSSLAAAEGWPGQTDYAFANGWLDGFAQWREEERRAGRRFGRTVSIQWPYWAEGGMRMDDEILTSARTRLGAEPLGTAEGLAALNAAVAGSEPVIFPLAGDAERLRRHFLASAAPEPVAAPIAALTGGALAERLNAELVEIVVDLLKVSAAKVDPARRLTDFGFDSITLTRFANRLNRSLGLDLTPALFFERPTLASLSEALLERHGPALEIHYGTVEKAADAPAPLPAPPAITLTAATPAEDDPIAIVGMAGRMPGSPDLEAFWEHLAAGDDMISEIPGDRWDWRSHADLPGSSRWGGFMEGIDQFDARFFGISPREAELMDPQQRLVLESVWQAIEDSGQRPGDLAGTDTGLFVGVATSDYYELLLARGIAMEAHTATGMSHCVLPNRISYLLDLHGPSEPVDTACSSSLVALARAADAIRRGDCSTAIVAGVNVMLTPNLYIAFGKAGMLSPVGRCKAFDQSADGYVRGEGVGAVVLKPLSKAIADGNPVHALLKGWAVNHGGRAQSLTAPNPTAQAAVIRKALSRAGIDPATVSHIEAHGTGTPLGDPIEIEGLKMVLSGGGEGAPCWLGSVKTAFGHLEAAAGIAGLIKVLLSMRHRRLPANVHFNALNPHIRLDGSRLRVLDQATDWTSASPLRAGVSSFGFGGANAHVVLESHESAPSETVTGPQIIVLSARSESSLKEQAAALARWLEAHPDTHLADLAFTLQQGREAFEHRLALVAGTPAEAAGLLRGLDDARLHRGLAPEGGSASLPSADQSPAALAAAWVTGAAISWDRLHAGRHPRRLSLPTTAFERRRHWVRGAETVAAVQPATPAAKVDGLLFHPAWELAPAASIAPAPAAGVVLIASQENGGELAQLAARRHPGQPVGITLLEDAKPGSGLRHVYILFDGDPSGDGAVLAVFRLVKRLLEAGYGARPLDITLAAAGAVAEPVQCPQAAGAFALLRSAAREFPTWTVRCLDLDPAISETAESLLTLLERAGTEEDFGAPLAIRQGKVLRRVLRPADLPAVKRPPHANGGTYVLVGGAGGIGGLYARTLARDAKATVVLMGRRPRDSSVDALLAEIGREGGKGLYLQADATDAASLTAALDQVIQRFGSIDGIVHAAMVLNDGALTEMSEQAFLAPFHAKAKVTLALAEALRTRPVRHLILLSSVQTLLCNGGQANYAAGCAFQDSLADQLKAGGLPVQVIQWGYWGGIGSVATPENRARMARLGIGSIEADEGMEALRRQIASGGGPLVVARATPAALSRLAPLSSESPPPSHLIDALSALDLLTRRATLAALERNNAFDREGGWRSLSVIGGILKVKAAQERLFGAVISMLAETPWVERQGDTLRLTQAGQSATNSLDADWDSTAARHPEIAAHAALLRPCADALCDVLSGRRAATDVLLPDGTMAQIEPIYRGNEIADRQNRAVAQWVRREVESRHAQGQMPVKLVEIGAGTGGTSAFIFDALADLEETSIGYWYTDVSKAFLQHGWRVFHPTSPFSRFEVLDIARPPSSQGFPSHGFDIVVAANVLHAVMDIGKAVGHVAQLLRKGGCLVLNELTGVQAFNTVTFGLLDGWWAPKDPEKRLPNAPLLSLAGWRRELAPYGLDLEQVKDDGLGLTVMLARQNRTILVQEEVSAPSLPAPRPRKAPEAAATQIHDVVLRTLAGVLMMEPDEIASDRSYIDYGVDSILAVESVKKLNAALDITLRPTDLFNHPTIDRLASHIAETFAPAAPVPTKPAPKPAFAPIQAAEDEDPLLQVLALLQQGEIRLDEVEAMLEQTL